MLKTQMIELMNEDLSREYGHWHFYMHAGINVSGLHREEMQEFFLKEASGEMQHIKEFGCAILGLGGTPKRNINLYNDGGRLYTEPKDLLTVALNMEKEVVEKYSQRMANLSLLSGAASVNDPEDQMNLMDYKFLEAFYEGQLLDSRTTVDNIKQMLI